MSSRQTFTALALAPLVCLAAAAQEPPPEGAMKYHAALLKSPENTTLFDRFFNAWLDAQPVGSLEHFLTARSESHGGADLALLARFQIRRGLEDAALATLGKAIAARPQDPTLPMARAGILLRRLEFDAARGDLAKVAAGNDPALALEAAKLTGKSYLREGRPEDALKTWDALLAAHPGDEELLEDLAESAAAESQTEQAIAYLDRLIGTSADPYRKTLRQLRRAELLARAGKSDEAALAYSAALANVGEGSWLEREILAQFGKLFRSQDRLSDLKDELRKMAEANPRRLLLHRQLAQLEAADGETDSAIGRFREVLRRSPGEAELREEFIKLLIDSKRFEDAAAELEKMIALAPENAELHLRMAALSAEQEKPDAVLASLEKARSLLGADEAAGLRIASLMLGYALQKEGEALLEKLRAAEAATPAPAEALASEYARTNRKQEALTLLETTATSADLEILIRLANSISRLGDSDKAHSILQSRLADFPDDPRLLTAVSQAALAASKPAESVAPAMNLIRTAKQESEIRDAVALAARAIAAAGENEKWRAALADKETPGRAETCLLAALTESAGDFPGVKKLFAESADPLLVRFHASLLEKRGDFTAALDALQTLAETEEGRKASFYKELSELQIRAGKTQDALGTLEKWKLSAPGDRTPWLIASNLLRNVGRTDEALATTRSALARFADDEDLAAGLAHLHIAVGAYPDAEEIYWRLYDSSPEPVSQSRWAAQLATLAQQTSKTTELQEKFEVRARNNRRSIGPILAQIELARVMRDEVSRRDLLQQALRLQPQKTDLRIQLADIEEKAGNAQAAIAVIQEGLDADKTGSLLSALAQAHIRQGDVLKGTRMLRAISSDGGTDPRLIESLAVTLLTAGFPEEAVRFLQESLSDGGDWRTKYLLAAILEADGREDEALPLLISLQQAEGDLPGIPLNPRQDPSYRQGRINSLLAAKSQIYQSDGTFRSSGGVLLPSNAEQARLYSLVRLAKLAGNGGENTEALIRDAGVEGIGFARRLLASSSERPDYLELLEKYPNEPELFQIAVQALHYDREEGNKTRQKTLFTKLLESEKLEPFLRLQAAGILLTSDKEDAAAWQHFLSAAEKCAESEDASVLSQTGHRIIAFLSTDAHPDDPFAESPILEKHILPLTALLLRICESEALDPAARTQLRLSTFAVLGKPLVWITEINSAVDLYRKSQMQALKSQLGNRRYNPWQYGFSDYTLPNIHRIWLVSLPMNHFRQIQGDDQTTGRSANMSAKSLLEHLDRIESPALRAFVAIKAGDSEKAREILSAEPPQEESSDFLLLKSVLALGDKDLPLAYRLFDQSEPEHAHMAALRDFSLLAIAREMTPGQREAVAESLRGILDNAAKQVSSQGTESLVSIAKEFGFEDLEKRFIAAASPAATLPNRVTGQPPNAKPTGPAAVFTSRPVPRTSSSSRPPSPLDRVRKFSQEGKTEAAAREILLYLRRSAKIGNLSESVIKQALEGCGGEIRTALLALTAPGDSRSLTRILFHIDVCLGMGETAEAIRELENLVSRRLRDTSLAIRLAFILPPEKSEQALALLTRTSTSADFAIEAYKQSGQLLQSNEPAVALAHTERITSWLESSPPDDLSETNLGWISFQSLTYFRGRSRLPSLLQPLPENKNEPDLNPRCADVGKRLAAAMMRHPALAEEGFRLQRAAKAWETTPQELDEMARRTLLIAVIPDPEQPARQMFHILDGQNSSSAGENLAEFSSMAWLVSRLETQNPAEVFPPAYLTDLLAKNPRVGAPVKAFTAMKNVAGLAEAWDSEAMLARDPISAMISDAVLDRASGIPGASDYFLGKIKAIKPGSVLTMNGSSGEIRLMKTAFRIAASRGGPELEKVCEAIVLSLVDGKPGWETQEDYQKLHSISNCLQLLLADQRVPLRSFVATLRILERRDMPFFNGEQWLNLNLQSIRVTDTKQGIGIFESLGMLDDAKDWKPLATLIAASRSEGNQHRFVRERKILDLESGSLRLDIPREGFIAALENHRPQTFGSLIAAASFTSGGKRGELTAAAFALAKPAFRKMPDGRLEDFTRFLSWLPVEAHPALPEYFQNKVRQDNEKRLAELLGQVESSKNSASTATQGLSNISRHIAQIAVMDLGKAVEIFLEAERTYTAELAQGGVLSSNDSPDAALTERDVYLNEILSAIGSLKPGHPELMLRFLNAVCASPEAGRFSLATRYWNGLPLLRSVGEIIYRNANKGKPANPSQWLGLTAAALEVPADLHDDSLAAAAIMALERRILDDLRKRETIAGSTGKTAKYRAFAAAALSFGKASPEERALASEAITKLLLDESLKETTRMQLAFTLPTMAPGTLEDPAIAAAIADLFAAYCKADRSAVNQLALSVITPIRNVNLSEANLPHLKRIHSAFWKNADALKPGGHPEIGPRSANSLFFAALALGDGEITARLFPALQPALKGNVEVILQLVSGGHFTFAAGILPEENQMESGYRESFTYTAELDEKLAAFRQTDVDPSALLRLEVTMLSMHTAEGAASKSERAARLAETYRAHPPRDARGKAVLLAALATSTDPASGILSSELTEMAESLNPRLTLHAWANTREDPDRIRAASEWDILCKAAANRLVSGEAAPFVTLLAVVEKTSRSTDERSSVPNLALDRILKYILPATCAAITDGKTGGFSKLIDPLGSIAVTLSKPRLHNREQIVATLALCELLAYWEGKPEAFSAFLGQINGDTAERLQTMFSFPRHSPPFLDALTSYNRGEHQSLLGPMPLGFPLAFFSHPPISDLLPSTSVTWYSELARSNLKESVAELALGEFPESITPAGRTILLLHRDLLLRNLGRKDEIPAANRDSLAVMPAGKPWDTLRTLAKCRLAYALLNENNENAEARALMDSINPQEVTRSHKSFYESLLKRLNNAEAAPD